MRAFPRVTCWTLSGLYLVLIPLVPGSGLIYSLGALFFLAAGLVMERL